MGMTGQVLSFERQEGTNGSISQTKFQNGEFPETAPHFADPGDDSHPLPDDLVALSATTGTGAVNAVAYLDPKNKPKTQPGEKRIYARDENGAAIAEFWLKNDGSIFLGNAKGSIGLQANGNVIINGVEIDTDGNITTPAKVEAAELEADSIKSGVNEFVGHTHTSTTPGNPTGPFPVVP